jgi:hypothetical protein
MVVCLAASRDLLRAQAMRYMVGGVAGESLAGNLAGLNDYDVPGVIHLLKVLSLWFHRSYTCPEFLNIANTWPVLGSG